MMKMTEISDPKIIPVLQCHRSSLTGFINKYTLLPIVFTISINSA